MKYINCNTIQNKYVALKNIAFLITIVQNLCFVNISPKTLAWSTQSTTTSPCQVKVEDVM